MPTAVEEGIIVRRSCLGDAVGFHALLDTVARERRFLLLVEAPPLEQVEAFLTSIAEKGDVQFVAERGSELVGWCDVVRHTRPGLEHAGQLGMGVHPDYRRNRVGQQLLTTAVAAAFASGIERVELEVLSSNAAALALYQKAGFVEEGRKRLARKIDGREEDFILMAKFGSDLTL